ncbi:hypothetical protein PRIPAC_75188 [Pristionchus pacificus]|uniref:Uncharacterized protein n=1 Tax=Pristionchus pacificus TaxID=54126 RepID=A0A2A6CFL0_PRIPA|nr:hypothetical protein PRIPAC_75188 [Pristionchus pacificus]|eukprot:PDM76992.1 hypothetical protein PRIPAC_42387 [Pristionchus pacificus]
MGYGIGDTVKPKGSRDTLRTLRQKGGMNRECEDTVVVWILGYWMDPRREIGDWIDVDTEDGKGLGPGSGDSPTTQG